MTRSLVTLLLLGLSCVSGGECLTVFIISWVLTTLKTVAPTASTSPQIGNQLYMKSKLDRDADRRPGRLSQWAIQFHCLGRFEFLQPHRPI
ncbi:hypothetical protein F5051DRAFT_405423 [Lentinula edodes]|nr:hypothetical protein F5051DRAFT_405423 [Lentinula edodes]